MSCNFVTGLSSRATIISPPTATRRPSRRRSCRCRAAWPDPPGCRALDFFHQHPMLAGREHAIAWATCGVRVWAHNTQPGRYPHYRGRPDHGAGFPVWGSASTREGVFLVLAQDRERHRLPDLRGTMRGRPARSSNVFTARLSMVRSPHHRQGVPVRHPGGCRDHCHALPALQRRAPRHDLDDQRAALGRFEPHGARPGQTSTTCH